MGATLHATVDQFGRVLKKIYDSTAGSRMHPNEIRAAFKAVRGLFSSLVKHPQDKIIMKHLYLPSTNGVLIRSDELLFNNDPTYTYRIQDFDKQFLVDLVECQVSVANYEDLIKKLPIKLRPVMLTSLVKEKLEESSRRQMITSTITERLRYQIQSRSFSHGIARLLRHEHYRSGQKLPVEVVESVQDNLRNIRVLGASKVVTHLTVEGKIIAGSELESDCFVESERINQIDLWNIYVARSASLNEELLVSIADVVNAIIGGLLKNSLHYLQPILSCAPHSITKVLDRLKVRPDHSVDFIQPTLPVPGSFVPIEDHHLLREDFDGFEQGEYVGYELDDDEDKYAPTYIYAIVLEKITGDETNSLFCSKYQINVGDVRQTVTAHATDLYKFHRITGFVSRPSSTTTEDTGYHMPKFAESRSVSLENILDGDEPISNDNPSMPPQSNIRARKGFRKHPRRKKSGSEEPEPRPELQPEPRPDYSSHHSASHTHRTYQEQEDTSNFSTNQHVPDFSEYQNQYFEKTNHDDSYFQTEHHEEIYTEQRSHQDSDVHTEYHYEQKEHWNHNEDVQCEDGIHDEEQEQTHFTTEDIDDEDDADCAFDGEEEEVIEVTLEEVMNEISDCLEEGWKLSAQQRKKVIKRLLLRWHPDKNIGDERVATIMTQHIYAEIERLDQGLPRPAQYEEEMSGFSFDPRNPFAQSQTFQKNFYSAYKKYYDEANERAKTHREQRKKYQENFSRQYSSGEADYNFDVPPSFSHSNPQPAQARRFFRQAQEDLRAADNDYDAKEPAYEWVCFKSHQVRMHAYNNVGILNKLG